VLGARASLAAQYEFHCATLYFRSAVSEGFDSHPTGQRAFMLWPADAARSGDLYGRLSKTQNEASTAVIERRLRRMSPPRRWLVREIGEPVVIVADGRIAFGGQPFRHMAPRPRQMCRPKTTAEKCSPDVQLLYLTIRYRR
jgi:hypothetical protein